MDMMHLLATASHALEAGRTDEARELWQTLRNEFSDHPAGYVIEAVFCRDSGDLERAEALMAEAVERFSFHAEMGVEFAMLAARRGDIATMAARLGSLHQRLKEAADACRAAGNMSGLNTILASLIKYFPADLEAGCAYVDLATDPVEKRNRWLGLPSEGQVRRYYQIAWDIVVADVRAGGLDETPAQLFEAMLSEPFGGNDWFAPHFIREWVLLEEFTPDLAVQVSTRFGALLADGRDLTAAAEMAVATMRLDAPGVDRARLLAKLLLQDDFRRVALIFYPPENIALVPAFSQLLMATGALDRVAPAHLYNVWVVLKCIDQDQWERFLDAVVAANPEQEADPAHPFGVMNQAWQSRRRRVAIPNHGQRLKIAMCISGQLREFRLAWPTWKKLGLDRHDLDVYVHTWCVVGKKPPLPVHAGRVFQPNFCKIYQDGFVEFGPVGMHQRYPGLFRHFFGDSTTVTEADLAEFYGATKVVVEDDRQPPFAELQNPVKMYYKVQSCFDLMRSAGQHYDLVIRTRPDLGLFPDEPADWNEIHHRATRDRTIFTCGNADFLMGPLGHKVGDVWAAGDMECMAHYSYSYSDAYRMNAARFHGAPDFIGGHVNFAYQMLVHGIRTYDLGYKFHMTLIDDVLSGDRLRAILLADMNGSPRDDFDARMLEACRADELAAAQS